MPRSRSHTRPPALGVPLVVVFAVTALGAWGCAGNSATISTSAPDATSPTHASTSPTAASRIDAGGGSATFVARAEAICRRLNDRLAATAPHKGDSAPALARNALQHAALERATSNELGKLSPPRALARDWRQIVADRRVLAADLVTLGGTLSTGHSPETSGLLALKGATHKAMSQLAKHDGFVDCAKVGTAQ